MKRLLLVPVLLLPASLTWVLWPKPKEDFPAAFGWLSQAQNPEGSWGEGTAILDGQAVGRAGLTGLALTTFLDYGYSHLSKDQLRGKGAGDVAREGLKWLLADQRPDGTFRSGTGSEVDHALSTLALTEAYGVTGSTLFQPQAQLAVDALVRMQSEDGSFGDAAGTLWAAEVLHSALVSGLSFRRSVHDGLRRYFETRPARPPEPGDVTVRLLLDRDRDDPAVAAAAEELAARIPDLANRDYAIAYHAANAVYLYWNGRPEWERWNRPVTRSLLDLQSRRGSWPGRTRNETIVQTCLAARTLSVNWRFPWRPSK